MVTDTAPKAGARTILVVDDDASIRELIGSILKRSGFSTVGEVNGWEGMEWLRRAIQLPCLILLDLRMPVMDGWKFRQLQLEDPRLAGIPVVIITSAAEVAEDVATVKAAAFLKKPLQVDLLTKTVRQHAKP